MMTDSERQKILVEWNNTGVDLPKDRCIHHLFEEQVARTPDAIALIFRDAQLTYAELNRSANQLAHHLQGLGVGPDTIVGISVERSLAMIVGLLGILKAGGAYLPLDPTYPPDRLAFMLQDAAPRQIVAQAQFCNMFPHASHVILLDADAGTISEQPSHNPISHVTPAHLAYVIYTSGSTGQPKGVLVEHRGLYNLAQAQINAFCVEPGHRVLQVASLNFDASISEIVMALGAGATLVLASVEAIFPGPALTQTLQQQAITHVTLVPSALALLTPTELPEIQTLIVAGEACSATLGARWQKGRRFLNAYGPTEITVCATIMDCATWCDQQQPPPIGRPLANTQIYLLDQTGQPVPVGVTGELYIGGVGVARGYLNRPELTAEKFITNPFDSGRLYKTGDLARWLPDGNIEFLGRIDQQVKLRGFRIELGEIEAALNQHPVVQEAVVIPREEQAGHKQLVAYIVATQSDEETQSEHVATWQSLYENVYSQPAIQSELNLNLTGWNSSYTRQPIPEVEMVEWVANTVAEIRALGVQRVLEIGCGTGLLLAQLAPACEEYWGIDYSHQALAHVARLRASDPKFAHVQLAQRMADNLDGLAEGSFDCVIINSVVQHFPSIDYLLRVVTGAVRLVKPGGKIYAGDVRNYRLLAAYHASVQSYQAPPELPLTELQTRIQQHMQNEEELLIDPAFFYALPQLLPAISGVEVRLKRGRYHNELTRFRYQVILHIDSLENKHSTLGSNGSLPQEIEWRQFGSLTALQSHLQAEPRSTLVVRDIPNARVQADLATLEYLTMQDLTTVGQLKTHLARQSIGIDPVALWSLGEALSYQVHLTWSADVGKLDVCFTDGASADFAALQPAPNKGQPTAAWHTYANNPLRDKLNRTLVPQLRNHLKSKLPAYMIPAAFVLLDAMPLTPNGKIDRNALPLPSPRRTESMHVQSTPQSEVGNVAKWSQQTTLEQTIGKIWCDVLALETVSIHDNFFMLGGHSLLLVAVQERLVADLTVEISIVDLLHYPTVHTLAGYLRGRNQHEPNLLPKGEDSDKKSLDNAAIRQEQRRRRLQTQKMR